MSYVNICDRQFAVAVKALADIAPFDFCHESACLKFRESTDLDDLYRIRWAIARALNPSSICEIGIRVDYAALTPFSTVTLLSAVPSARYLGLDIDRITCGFAPGLVSHLDNLNAKIQVCKSRLLRNLPMQCPDLVHVNGNLDFECIRHYLDLAIHAEAKYVAISGVASGADAERAVAKIIVTYSAVQHTRFESSKGDCFFYVLRVPGDAAETGASDRRRVYFDVRTHRVGDKVVYSAILKWYRKQHPQDWIIVVDDYWFENGLQRSIPASLIFDGLIDECVYNTTPPNATRLDFGCLWNRVPWLAKQGYYPSIKVDEECEKKLLSRFGWMSNPYVCVHILEDAPYKKKRNHDFGQMSQFMEILTKHGVRVVRIGKWLGRELTSQTDLTPLGLSAMESACIIKQSAAYIGGDTGMTHIASAVGVPWILAIYGEPDDPRPWRNHARAIGCNVDFCALPCVPEERRTVFHMHNHRFSMSEVVNTCLDRLGDLELIEKRGASKESVGKQG